MDKASHRNLKNSDSPKADYDRTASLPILKKKILLVDDEESVRELYAEMLGKAGYAVETAMDGEEGLKKLKEGGWDVVLLDILMPKLDGLKVLDALRTAKVKKPNGPIILLTVLPQGSMIHQGLEKGAAGYLIKSETTFAQVLEAIRGFLGEK